MKDRRRGRPMSVPLDLEIFLCFAIYSANHAFNRVYKPLLEELGLTYPQYIVMVLLWERGGQTVGELGQKLFLESNTLTPLLKRLETLGFINRNRDPADERQVRVHLTEAGRKLRQRALHIPRCILDSTGLEFKQAEHLLEEIGALRKALESYNSEPERKACPTG
jgi:MarR family transcriptional regulator, organic hydroperoxide resistance regulator